MSSATGEPEAPADAPVERRKRRPLLQAERISRLFSLSLTPFGARRFVRAVDNVSLFVRHAEGLGLLGPRGSGKTTLALTLVRLLEPSYGRILFNETDITHLPDADLRPLRRRMQVVSEEIDDAIDGRQRARDAITEGPRLHGQVRAAGVDAVSTALADEVALAPSLLDREVATLSMGERTRVALARALALGPDLLICDETPGKLDPPARRAFVQALQRRQREDGQASVIISDDLAIQRLLTQRLAVLYAGRLVEVGPTDEVLDHPRHPFTRSWLSAAPRTLGRKQLRVVHEGPHPDPLMTPPGCVYHPRCAKSNAGQCDRFVPQLEPVDAEGRHRVACWLPEP